MTTDDDTRPGYVYRVFNAADELLYIGATINPGSRFSMHQSKTEWWAEVATVKFERFDTRKQALVAEGAAILAESPRLNLVGGYPPQTLDRRAARLRRDEERRVREATAPARARQRYMESTYAARGTVVCTNCGRYPQRIPKKRLLEDIPCKRCRCEALILVSTDPALELAVAR